jgi:5'-nucleotidase
MLTNIKKLNNILITNDDGFDSIGINLLKNIAMNLSDNVFIVAPKDNQSAKGRSISLNRKIKFIKNNKYEWVIEGTPTDCIIFALNHIMKNNKPDLILSGINAGGNIGDEVSYSGTVAASWEGALRGVKSIALSQVAGTDSLKSYDYVKNFGLQIINYIINLDDIEQTMLFNVNFPNSINFNRKDFLFTKLSNQKRSDEIFLDRNNQYFEIGKMLISNDFSINSDLYAIKNNKISITPLTIDLTNFDNLNFLINKNN